MIKNNLYSKILMILLSQKLRFLLAGGWNTAFGYACAVGLYYHFSEYFGVIGIGILSNIMSITMSFVTYKVFVFKTRGGWAKEYLRTYLVYGISSLIGILILYIGVECLRFPFWLVQGVAVILVTIISYQSHSRFTFK